MPVAAASADDGAALRRLSGCWIRRQSDCSLGAHPQLLRMPRAYCHDRGPDLDGQRCADLRQHAWTSDTLRPFIRIVCCSVKGMRCLPILCASLIVSVLAAADDNRGLKPMTVVDEHGASVTFTSSQALVIGNSAYTNGWDELKGVKDDVVAVRASLEAQGFSVQVAENLTKVQFNEVMDSGVSHFPDRPTPLLPGHPA
jgi:hypothetical protein